ncbi:hypothetical protein IWW37_002375 [Coemansia sp. RSA 2050]|nr:hypothetical protein IWW37_002375 [Coemansia sp. RSA 2050]
MHIRTSAAVSLAVALVGLQKASAVGATPDEDMRAGAPLRLDLACPNDEGKIICASISSLLICDHARWRFLSNCPDGTACQNDRCINKSEFTIPVIEPANPPPRPPAVPTTTTSVALTTTSAATTATATTTTTKPTSNTSNTTTAATTANSSSSNSSDSKTSSIPNISNVSELPIKNSSSKSKDSKPTGIPNISMVDKLPIPGVDDNDSESGTSSAAGQLSWNRLHVAIPVMSAIVVPYVISLLF